MIEEIRKNVKSDIIDSQRLNWFLRDYKKPRDKVKQFLDKGQLLVLRKGLYVFGEAFRREPLCLPLLANLVYGSSYVSLQYALSWYGMIPERVVEVTSVTTGRKRLFETPIGRFSYFQLSESRYKVGIDLVEDPASRHTFLMASPSKALADLVMRTPGIETVEEMREYLEEDLRFEPPENFLLDEEIFRAYLGQKLQFLQRALS